MVFGSWLAWPAVAAAFLTGLTGSAHCAVMCGPLACVGLRTEHRARRRAAGAWQAGRFAAYVTLGATFGGIGHAGLVIAQGPLSRVMPWLMAVGLIASAFELGKRWPALPGFARIPRLSAHVSERFSPTSRAFLRGAVTPFLPCGLVYGAFLAALGTGSPLSGGLLMGAFALGGLPALAVVQSQLPRLGASRPRLVPFLRRAVPVLAAAVVVWRALAVGPEGPPHCHGGHHVTDAASTNQSPTSDDFR